VSVLDGNSKVVPFNLVHLFISIAVWGSEDPGFIFTELLIYALEQN